MDNRKKESGAFYRKRKAERDKNIVAQKGSLEKYLSSSAKDAKTDEVRVRPLSSEIDLPLEDIALQSTSKVLVTEHKSRLLEFQARLNEYSPIQLSGNSDSVNTTSTCLINNSDPATWSRMTDDLRQVLVQHGPLQIKEYDFPLTNDGCKRRKFSASYYKRRLNNGEEIARQWLVYSVSTDRVFCFCCKIFGDAVTESSAFGNEGIRDWKNILAVLRSHEGSRQHLKNYQDWKELELRLQKGKQIDIEYQRLIKREEKHWGEVLTRLIGLVRVLAGQNLAFRGTSDHLYAADNGNFLQFVQYLAQFDPTIAEHLNRISNKETRVSYLGKNIQNELIELLAEAVKDKILVSLREAKYYSIILDTTPDVSHLEQMTIIVRFVSISSLQNPREEKNEDISNNSELLQIREHFLGFLQLDKTTGADMAEVLVQQLKYMSLSIEDIRGQGYDNGSNMKGKKKGVQSRILCINPRALYVPCSSHSLNLIVNDAASCCFEATFFFDIVQRLFVYFAASTQRWNMLKRHVSSLTVKPLSGTRWSSRIDALRPLRYQLGEIYDALTEISNDETLSTPSGNLTRVEAQGLLKQIANFKFVVSLIVWHDILFRVDICSKLLQTKEFNIHSAIKQLEKTEQYFLDCRSDLGYQKLKVDAVELAGEISIEPVFQVTTRFRKKIKQFDYEGNDQPIENVEEKFKVEFYFPVLDTCVQSIRERFSQLQEISASFGFLYDISSLKSKTTKEISDHCLKLEKKLTVNEERDVDAFELCSELQEISRIIPALATPKDVLLLMCENELMGGFPNLFVALRILLTLPVSVASAERSFSKLKLIKTYVRSTMVENRLCGLAMLSIERMLAQELDVREIIKEFSKVKARKVKLP